jgi:hypothetical protein
MFGILLNIKNWILNGIQSLKIHTTSKSKINPSDLQFQREKI